MCVPALVERWGVIRTMAGGAVVTTTGLLGAIAVTARSASTGRGWIPLLAIWAVLGMGSSLINTPSSRLLAAASTPANRGLFYAAQFALSHACFLVTYPIAGVLGAFDLTVSVLTLAALSAAACGAALVFAHRRLASRTADAPPVRAQ